MSGQKFVIAAAQRASFIRGSLSCRDRVFIFNPRYCHDDILFPRRRDCDRIAAAYEFRIRANDNARDAGSRGKNRAGAKSCAR
jgi:hypothetical protein